MKIRKLLFSFLVMMSCLAGNAYTIYPVPQRQQVLSGTATFTARVNIVADPSIDRATIGRAIGLLTDRGLEATVTSRTDPTVSNLYLGTDGSRGPADRQASRMKARRDVLRTPGKYDRHILQLQSRGGKADVLILGENTDATFCGLASLEQILDNGTSNLACVSIEDYADIRYRGVIEGYYGIPYNAEVTKDLFRFMARYKMNCYMYGAKSDPYHSQKWSEPYPDSITTDQQRIGMLSRSMMKEIVDVSHECKVNFIWAIHPGRAFVDPDDKGVTDRIMSKFQDMYDLGVRQFGVFVDDVGVPSDEQILKLNADRISEVQTAIKNRWNTVGASPADTVKPVNFVPQLYAYSWVDADKRRKYYAALGKAHPEVIIYITGAAVWSVPNSEDLDLVSGEIGRSLAWWWNYPCNDNDMTNIFIRDTYTNFAHMKAIDSEARLPRDLRGADVLIANPMQQGAASKIALFGIGDYSWNNAAFDNAEDYRAAIRAVVGNTLAADMEYLARHLSNDDSGTMEALIDKYRLDRNGSEIKAELLKILRTCQTIEESADSLLVADIQPWINKLSDMAFLGMQLLDAADAKVDPAIAAKLRSEVLNLESSNRYQFDILGGMGNAIGVGIRSATPGAAVLRPFLDYLAGLL